jgi:hypothetical protein
MLFACAAILAPAAAALQDEQKKDEDLPEHVRALPFEIRDGYRRFMKRCTSCHDTERVEKGRKSLFEWQGVIGEMAFKREANIPLEDRHPIFLYLSYLHGTTGAPHEKDEYLTFLHKCENCHGVSLVYKDKQPLKDWPEIINRMAKKNQADISAEDEEKIFNYINRMHPDIFGID